MKNKIKSAALTIAVLIMAVLSCSATEAYEQIDSGYQTQEVSYGGGESFIATFYGGGGITALGNPVYEGCCAVDPYVIPLGSMIYIEFPPGYEYLSGNYYACDTGGAVYGNTVDIYLDLPDSELYNLGVMTVTVYR